jgi:hypothetical protein
VKLPAQVDEEGDDGGINTLINHFLCLGKDLIEEGPLVLGRLLFLFLVCW